MYLVPYTERINTLGTWGHWTRGRHQGGRGPGMGGMKDGEDKREGRDQEDRQVPGQALGQSQSQGGG